jgi:hypothetical protein
MNKRDTKIDENGTILKQCSKCNEYKPLSEYHNHKGCSFGKNSVCKKCVIEDATNWYQKNREKVIQREKEYAEKNREKTRAYKTKYALNNPEKVKESNKKYAENNKDTIKARRKIYREKKKEKLKNDKKLYALNHPERMKTALKRYRENNRARIFEKKHEPYNHLVICLRKRVTVALKRSNAQKTFKTLDLIGCSIPYLKKHLEAQFQPGMTWENYGHNTWHIDHIRPCASFDLTDPEQQKQCFHYTNLQPLWAKDNMRKGARTNEAIAV